VKSKVIIFSILRILIEGYLLFRFPKFFGDLEKLSSLDKKRNVVVMASIGGSKNKNINLKVFFFNLIRNE